MKDTITAEKLSTVVMACLEAGIKDDCGMIFTGYKLAHLNNSNIAAYKAHETMRKNRQEERCKHRKAALKAWVTIRKNRRSV